LPYHHEHKKFQYHQTFQNDNLKIY